METVDILYAVAELRSDYCPRLEFKVTLGKQVTCITVLHLTDAVFHVRYQGIILRLRFLYLLFQFLPSCCGREIPSLAYR